MYTTFVRSLFVVLALSASFFAAELAFEWWRLGTPDEGAMSWAGTNNAKLVDLMSPVARAYNNVLAMLIAITALAPLSWSIYSVLSKPMAGRVEPVVWTYLATTAGTVMTLPLLPGPVWRQWSRLDVPGWCALLYLALARPPSLRGH